MPDGESFYNTYYVFSEKESGITTEAGLDATYELDVVFVRPNAPNKVFTGSELETLEKNTTWAWAEHHIPFHEIAAASDYLAGISSSKPSSDVNAEDHLPSENSTPMIGYNADSLEL